MIEMYVWSNKIKIYVTFIENSSDLKKYFKLRDFSF